MAQTRCPLPARSAGRVSPGESSPLWKHQTALLAANAGEASSVQSLGAILFDFRFFFFCFNFEWDAQIFFQYQEVSLSCWGMDPAVVGLYGWTMKVREFSLLEENSTSSVMLTLADPTVPRQPRLNMNNGVQNRCNCCGGKLARLWVFYF